MYSLTVNAPAKVNLFLEVVRKRADGYHDIESVFHELELEDRLCFRRREDEELRLVCDAEDLATDGTNLVLRAARLLKEKTGCRLGADIALQKRIPMNAGLGGGSSDAAAVFKALNALWDLDLTVSELGALGTEIGSDVPFFLYGGTCLCRGRGDLVEPLAFAPVLELVLVFPEWGISTGRAYAALEGGETGARTPNPFLSALRKGDLPGIASQMFNRFEEAVFRMEPRQEALYRALSALDFLAVRMTGSGSTFFGLVGEGNDPEALVRQARSCAGVIDALSTRSGRPSTA
ncbi:MAG: 4-(cytidine 5'-diphospho)-2-C-methyl-D-erythritol kinase [Planctomycetota bacterium]